MKRKTLTIVLTIILTISLTLPAFAMDLGLAAPAYAASAYAQAATQQVELTVNLAEMETAVAQPPIVSEGGNLNGGSGDINTIIVQGGTPTVGAFNVPEGETLAENSGTVDYNYGIITLNTPAGVVESNYGTIDTNRGSIGGRSGNIQSGGNMGKVNENAAGGLILVNSGTVTVNRGTIEGNFGTVTVNRGTIEDNFGTVVTNAEGGIIRVRDEGSVQKNYGKVENYGTVTENHGIIDNYENVEYNYGTVFNYGWRKVKNNIKEPIYEKKTMTIIGYTGIELFHVTINRSVNTSVTDATDGLVAHNGEAWKEEDDIPGKTATVTISPAAGYTITNIASAVGINPVQNSDGSWTVTVDASLVNSMEFTLDTEVRQDAPPSSYPPVGNSDPDPYQYGGYRVDPTYYQPEQYFADILPLLDITLEPAAAATAYNAGPNAFDSFNAETIAAVKDAPADSIVEIDLRKTGWTTLKRDVFEAAAARGDVTIIIYYSQWGRDYTLTIPAGTDLSAVISGAQYLDASRLPTLLNLKAE